MRKASTFFKTYFCKHSSKSWKTSAVSTTDWMVETQLCNLRGTSDTFVRIIWFLWTNKKLKNVSCEYDRLNGCRGFDSCRTHFLREEKKTEKKRKPHLRTKMGLCGERKLNLLNIKMMLRGSLTSDKNRWDRSCWKVPGAHTLLMSEGDERF